MRHGSQKHCELCRRLRSRDGRDTRRKSYLKGNQRDIERKALEAQQKRTSYGKWVGKEYAAAHVQVVIPQMSGGADEHTPEAATEEGGNEE